MEKEHKTKTLHSVRVEKIEVWSFFYNLYYNPRTENENRITKG